jgi:hypothetical protein
MISPAVDAMVAPAPTAACSLGLLRAACSVRQGAAAVPTSDPGTPMTECETKRIGRHSPFETQR